MWESILSRQFYYRYERASQFLEVDIHDHKKICECISTPGIGILLMIIFLEFYNTVLIYWLLWLFAYCDCAMACVAIYGTLVGVWLDSNKVGSSGNEVKNIAAGRSLGLSFLANDNSPPLFFTHFKSYNRYKWQNLIKRYLPWTRRVATGYKSVRQF